MFLILRGYKNEKGGWVEVTSQRKAQIASQIAVHLGIPRLTEVKTINGGSGQTCTLYWLPQRRWMGQNVFSQRKSICVSNVHALPVPRSQIGNPTTEWREGRFLQSVLGDLQTRHPLDHSLAKTILHGRAMTLWRKKVIRWPDLFFNHGGEITSTNYGKEKSSPTINGTCNAI